MIRFLLIFLFATAIFGAALAALNQPNAPASAKPAKAADLPGSSTGPSAKPCAGCPMPTN